MVRTIMAFFGYVKIPREVVLLSMRQSTFLENLEAAAKSAGTRDTVQSYIEAQKTITSFLRSGRLISYNNISEGG